MKRSSQRTGVGALALAGMIAIVGFVGCGGGSGASVAKADAVEVTYYYLPL